MFCYCFIGRKKLNKLCFCFCFSTNDIEQDSNKNRNASEIKRGYATAPVSSCESNEYLYNTSSRTNLNVNHHLSYPNMDYQNNEYYERTSPQRRVLRQSTLPTNLPHPDQYQYQNNMNLMPPVSPNQQISPQYSPYNTDNEDVMDISNPDLRSIRYPIRRQSTLPSRPSDHYYQQQPQQQQQFFSTSPNRNFNRSPEKSDSEQQLRMVVNTESSILQHNLFFYFFCNLILFLLISLRHS